MRNNPLSKADADGHDGWDMLLGVANAVRSDFIAGIGRTEGGNSDFNTGQRIGDAISVAGGALETVYGALQTSAGVAASATGVGAIAGVPAAVAGAAVATHGAVVTGSAAANLLKKGNEKAGGGKNDQTDTRAKPAEKNTVEGAQNQADSLHNAQDTYRRNGNPNRIESTTKSDQRLKNALKKIKKASDVEEH